MFIYRYLCPTFNECAKLIWLTARFYIIIIQWEVGIVPVVCRSCEYLVRDSANDLPFFGMKQLF